MIEEIDILRSLVRLRESANTAIGMIESGLTIHDGNVQMTPPYHYRIRQFYVHDAELEPKCDDLPRCRTARSTKRIGA